MPLPHDHLVVFVATRADGVPAAARPFASVDGAVPGASVTWDHHQSGELVNMDAMPARIDARELRGVGTTMADTDAAISAALVLLGGRSAIGEREARVLLSAAHWCDHLRPHPEVLEPELDRAGERLHAWVCAQLRAQGDDAFAPAARRIAECLATGAPLPESEPTRDADKAHALDAAGRIHRFGPVALVDLRGAEPIDPLATYEQHRCSVAITLADHDAGGRRYTVGVNPFVPDHPTDLRPALEALASAEHAHGPPCTSPEPGAEGSWGGRATVFGSPWNYGSRLSPDEVVRIVTQALFSEAT